MAAFIGKNDEIIASFMKELYSQGGELLLTQIAKFLNCKPDKASKWLSNYPNYFKIIDDGVDGSCSKASVLGVTHVTLCKKHASNPGSCSGCDSLHVCKFFVLGDSCKFGADCKYSHNFETVPNKRVLTKYLLYQLNEQELKCLFQKLENRNDVTTPKICKFFNNNCCKKTDCVCLHICKHYLMNDCTFGIRCKINHDLRGRNTEILEMYGIPSSRISDAIKKLRILYGAEIQTSEIKQMSVPKVDIICLHHLSSKRCTFKETCRYYHKEMPYQWQYKPQSASDDAVWKDFNTEWNEQIEGKFCNLENETHVIDSKRNKAKFQFDIMKCFIADQEYLLHRLSTVSYKSDPRSPLTTTWIWSWKDADGIWIEYGSTSSTTIDVTNEDIEKSYLDNPEGTMVIKIDGKLDCEINFQQMYQKCLDKRKVIRRPKFISGDDVAELRQKPFKSLKKLNPNLPLNWGVPADVSEISSHFRVIEVDKASKEFKTVSDQFDASIKETSITKIERIENGNLWEYYNWKKMKMMKELSGQDLRELNLFHGTELDSIDSICKQGFDVRLSGIRIGSKYGKGIYFCKDAGFAHNYIIPVNNEYKVLLANVVVGEFAKGIPSYLRPPPKNLNEKGGKLYDSCVDNVDNPKLFVIFLNEQTYPAYIITYIK